MTRAVRVDQPLIDRFADCSRDDQWVQWRPVRGS